MLTRYLTTSLLGLVATASSAMHAAAQTRPEAAASDPRAPVQVFILLGQSNMVGFGRIEPADRVGTLAQLCEERGMYPHLRDDDGKWIARNDVWCVKTTVGQRQGWLRPGFGARPALFGPELQFGHVVGDALDEPVLIIKASQGNRSLGWDILPPGSERFEYAGRTYAGYKDTPDSWVDGEPKKPVNWYAGKQYDDFVRDIREVLNDLPKFWPSYDAESGYEIAGFAWWQGHKDQNAAHASRYELNLVNLIKCLREEFGAPNAPFVLATIGFGGDALKGHGLTVLEAQLAVDGDRGEHPEFHGNVKAIDARAFWRDEAVSPANQGHHYNQNAETFMAVGDALGRAMIELLRQRAPDDASRR